MASERGQAYEDLRNNGMLYSEARRMSLLPNRENYPWLKELENERRKQWKAARRRGISRKRFEEAIVSDYRSNNWLVRGLKQVQVDVYAMLRNRCDRYRAKHPEYESPWEERQRSFMRYARAVDRTIKQQDQPQGQPQAA